MAELCTAFKRIVPRYQFSTNQAAFIIEDMNDAPRCQPPKCNGSSACNRAYKEPYNRPYSMYVHRKCHWPQSNSRCTSMDTCGNVQDKMRYFYKY